MMHPEPILTPGLGIAFDCQSSSRNTGHRKVQPRTEQDTVELSHPRGETNETEYTGRTLEGTPLFPSLRWFKLTA